MPKIAHVSRFKSSEFCDQTWAICEACGCIQLISLIELEELYATPHNSVAEHWNRHNELFSDYVVRHGATKILEIGGGNLSIASIVAKNEKTVKYKIYDTNFDKAVSASDTLEFEESFFIPEKTNESDESFNAVVLSHTFEHLYNPVDYLKEFQRVLSNRGKLILSVPNTIEGLKRKFTNMLNFEHTYSLDKENVNFMMEKTGFKLIDLTVYSDYNFFVVYEKTDGASDVRPLRNRYVRNKRIFDEYVDYHKKNILYLNKEIEKNENSDVYLFGSGPFSQFLIYMGLDVKRITGVLDENVSQHSYKLYGTDLPIHDPKAIKELKNPRVIVQAGAYTEEIMGRLSKINANVKIIK